MRVKGGDCGSYNARRRELEQEVQFEAPYLFISAVSGDGLYTLKDMLWEELNRDK